MSAGPNLGLAPSVEHLITELDAVRDTLRDQTESEWTRQMLRQVAFEEHHGPRGIRAQIWGAVVDNFVRSQMTSIIHSILIETHQQYGISGAVEQYDNTSWLFRWDDQS